MTQSNTKFARKCKECGKGMNEGYVINGGVAHYCSDACLHKHVSADEFEDLHDDGDGDSYWTEWEEGDCDDEPQATSDWDKVSAAFDILEELELFLRDLADRGDYQAKVLHKRVMSVLNDEQAA
jgi:hypothetical protein